MTDFIATSDVIARIGKGGTADAGLISAVAGACEMVRTFTEQDLASATETITVDGPGTDAIVLPQRPVNSVGTVNLISSTGATTAVSDFAVDGNGVLLRTRGAACPSVWPTGRQNVEITYSHGYGTVPDDLKAVAIQIASRLVVQGVASSETMGQNQIAYAGGATDITPGEKMVLAKYRQVPA